jgi:hypothetical protein
MDFTQNLRGTSAPPKAADFGVPAGVKADRRQGATTREQTNNKRIKATGHGWNSSNG